MTYELNFNANIHKIASQRSRILIVSTELDQLEALMEHGINYMPSVTSIDQLGERGHIIRVRS